MAFNANDIYVEGGNNKILHSWTPGVEKFDTSSFYNWEQDNIPLYDLEERTYYLWEKSGWPTSGSPQVSGVVFSVSADAIGTDTYANDPNLFLDLSSAINALPDVIRYPIRIEVANYGNLGELVLNNLHFTDNGALEIINRNFSKINPGITGTVSSFCYGANKGTAAGNDSGNTNVYMTSISSVDLSSTLAATKLLNTSSLVCSGGAAGDPRWNNNSIIFSQPVHEVRISSNYHKTGKLSVGIYPSNPLGLGTANVFQFTNYGNLADTSIDNYDLSSVTNEITASLLPKNRLDLNSGTDVFSTLGIVGAFYGSYLTKLVVNNCAGKIYIRNFVVDGGLGEATPTTHSTRNGIDINNSEIVLENCAALRCFENGFNLVNSKVIISRGAFSYRNYGKTGASTRDTSIESAGFNLVNSNVTLSSVSTYDSSGAANPFVSNRNQIGIKMHNSTLTGGDKRITGADSLKMTSVQSFENSIAGIRLKGSTINLNGALDTWVNEIGIDSTNSEILVDELYVDNNQNLGAHLKNSRIIYAKNAPDIVAKTVLATNQNNSTNVIFGVTGSLYNWAEDPGMVNFDCNGQHLLLENSKMTHPRLVLAEGLSRTKFKRNRGAVPGLLPDLKISKPAIVVDSNSELDLTYARIQSQTAGSFGSGGNNSGMPIATEGQGGTSNPNKGTCLIVKNNSSCRLVGGENKFTFIDGPEDYEDQIYSAGIFVDKHSTLDVYGPTLMMRHGVNVLLDNQSTLNITPPKDEQGFIDNAQWELSSTGNQTKVDLHSTRACLVATNNSTINMEDCGDYNAQWAKSAADAAIEGDANAWYASGLALSANYSTYETSAFHSQGSIQFYPNPQLQSTLATYDPPSYARDLYDTLTMPLLKGDVANDVTGLSFGGMCLRAMSGSKVKVKNVNFPCGWNNTSSIYYNYDSVADPNGCQQLRIWNIDPTSKLDMSYISVSGHFPPLVGYNGPSAVYPDPITGLGFEGAPDNTPYTSSLSVLDSFGPSGTAGTTHSDPQNFGPFRLYFTPKQFTKYLVYKDQLNDETGMIYQTIAQGYNPSGACSAIGVYALGPDYYGVYGTGPTSPSGIQGALTVSSLTASAHFEDSPMGRAKDYRWYTSAVAYTAVASGTQSCNRGSYGSDVSDNIPGRDAADCGFVHIPPIFKHYKESDFFYAKDLLPQDYDSRIFLDESAIAAFANAKNATMGTSGRPKLVTMITSTTSWAGTGAQSERDLAGRGFLSASEFDLSKLD